MRARKPCDAYPFSLSIKAVGEIVIAVPCPALNCTIPDLRLYGKVA